MSEQVKQTKRKYVLSDFKDSLFDKHDRDWIIDCGYLHCTFLRSGRTTLNAPQPDIK